MSRQILVLARRDPLEAMRVAAGLTIFGHDITLVVMGPELKHSDYESGQFDLLEMAEIEPLTTASSMSQKFRLITPQDLGVKISVADAVLNI